MREKWELEKKQRESAIKDAQMLESRKREREKEEYEYSFKREQQLSKDRFTDEKEKLTKELDEKREAVERDLAEREKIVAEREKHIEELEGKIAALEQKLPEEVDRAIKQTTEKLQDEAKNKEEMMMKEFDGERNVLTTRIQSLEKTVKEQNEQISGLSKQLDKAASQVQDIAVKAIEGSSSTKILNELQQWVAEQSRKQPVEK
jgi:hypothetical protein